LLVRRDPRDLSRVFVLDPLDGGYLEVPTRDLSRPAISLWEHRPHGLRRQLRRTLLVRAAAFRGIWQRPMFSANADRSAPSAKKRDFTQRTAGGAECREMSAPISAARWPLTYPARPLPDNDVAV